MHELDQRRHASRRLDLLQARAVVKRSQPLVEQPKRCVDDTHETVDSFASQQD